MYFFMKGGEIMAIIATELEGSVKMVLNAGTDLEGNTISKSKTFSRVKPTATNEDAYAVANGIAGLQDYPVIAIRKFEEFDLVEGI